MSPRLFAVLVLGAVCGCSTQTMTRCAAGERVSISDLLYFGTAQPGGSVSADDWSNFLRDTVTPRFPEGLTTWQAAGQWRSADGTLIHEGSFVLSLVHPASQETELAIHDIVSQYKRRFQQEAVLRVKSHACTSL